MTTKPHFNWPLVGILAGYAAFYLALYLIGGARAVVTAIVVTALLSAAIIIKELP